MRMIITYKQVCLLAMILLISIPSQSQKKRQQDTTKKSVMIDSVYYDNKWRGVPDKAFASFLRVYSTPFDTIYKKQYRDYYTTGEVKGEGYYISIDPMDGTKSIYEGEQISYYKSGITEYKEYWEDGKIGEKTIYAEDGLPLKHMEYIDGNLDGTYTEFLDNGLYMQIEYKNGKPINPYYTVFDRDGRKLRYDMSGLIINDIPTDDDMKEEYQEGMHWYYYDMNGITIAACSGTFNRYGKYYKQLITIKNNLMETVDFDPDKTEAFVLNKDNDTIRLKTLSADDYTEAIQRQKGIFAAIAGVTAVTASVASASMGVSPTSTYTSNIETNVGGQLSNATVTTSVYDYDQSYRNGVIMGEYITNIEHGFNAASEDAYEGYLKRQTLRTGESMSGYILYKYEKGKSFMSRFHVNGMSYQFYFDIDDNQKNKKDKKDEVKTEKKKKNKKNDK